MHDCANTAKKKVKPDAYRVQSSRRQLLAYGGGMLAWSVMPAALLGCGAKPPAFEHEMWISAHGASVGQFGLGWVDASPGPRSTEPGTALTGFRGHAAVQHPGRPRSVLMLARRPGTRGIEIDLVSGQQVAGFECAEGRHLFGHGCFSADGKTLFTTEAEYATGEGKIAVRDALSYQLLEEWSAYGIGPHELRLMPDGRSLAVANSGILTHPQYGRKPLNLDSMCSTLTYIDVANGGQLGEFAAPEPKASIRHLDVAADGTVAFATQLQRAAAGHNRTVALGGRHRPGKALELFDQPARVIDQLQDYMGSVAISNHSRLAGFASPRGNLVAFWQLDDGSFAGYHRLRDVCGIATGQAQQSFVISNSFGELRELDAVSLQENRNRRVGLPQFRWDNHLLVLDTV